MATEVANTKDGAAAATSLSNAKLAGVRPLDILTYLAVTRDLFS